LRAKDAIERTGYTVPGDFCRIFAEDMNALYWFSFLLTADREKAEQCFLTGLEDCVEGNRIFKEWARSWARRAIVQSAIRIIRPTPDQLGPMPVSVPRETTPGVGPVSLAAVLGLKPFERFVFVLSVLERYSDQECSTLLGCSRQNVMGARAKALEHIAASSGRRLPDRILETGDSVLHGTGMTRIA
jgi:DNA-directed RNA polymerase specialized sigma24 family protein